MSASSSVSVTLREIDWKLLRSQKRTLVALSVNERIGHDQREDLAGVVSLLDWIQDDASGQIGSAVVFGDGGSGGFAG